MDDAYQWVPFYEALADKLLTYSDKRKELFDLVKKLSEKQSLMDYLHLKDESWWEHRQYTIDPFSVIGIINRGQTTYENRTMLAKILADGLAMDIPVPKKFDGIPVLNSLKSIFGGIDEVWNLFIVAINSVKKHSFTDEFYKAFETAIVPKNNGLANITMGLYWIRPNVFMPLDANSRAFIFASYGIDTPKSLCRGSEYVTFLNTLNAKVDEQTPGRTFPEISYASWTQKDDLPANEQEQRVSFTQWYIANAGTPASANTIATALGKSKLKNGRAVFSIARFETLDTAIKNCDLNDYFQTRDGDYAKMDAVFDLDETVQRDDLKSGIKYYLNFLKIQGRDGEKRKDFFKITPEEAKIIDIDISDNVLIDKLHQQIKNWEYDCDVKFSNVYNVYENGNPNFINDGQRIEYLQLLRQIRIVCGGQRIPNTKIYNILTSDTRGVQRRKNFSHLNGWIGLNRPLRIDMGNNTAFNHIIETHKDYIFKKNNALISQVKSDEQGTVMIGKEFLKKDYEKNLILYGPPGTGKTYSSIQYAVSIVENRMLSSIQAEDYADVFFRYLKYKNDGLIAFTTFHQSFGYEEFIEGIRPVVSSEETAETGRDIEYEIHDGIFKAFCDSAGVPVGNGESADLGIAKNPCVWKVSLAGTGDNPTRRECLENNHIRLGWDEYGKEINDETDYFRGGKAALNAFNYRMQLGDIVMSCYSSKTVDAIGIITGEPEWHGEYDHYKRVRNVKWLAKGINEDIIALNAGKSMTLSSVYKLSISVSDILKILKKVNPTLFAQDVTIPNRVFIIDEINRGNISKIFGELITLIEPSKRIGAKEELSATLPYSGKAFGIPDNVYIIGTMNTADRSIALIDTALRRRFSFIEMQPKSAVLTDVFVDNIDIEKMLDIINKRIAVLLDREHTIGHSYLLPLKKNPTIENLAEIFGKKIIPLLQEYFYDDYEKIQLVLGDNQKEDTVTQFIVKKSDGLKLFGNTDIDIADYYEINSDAFTNIEAYALLQ